jgi:hypothetical protein
MFRKKHHPHSQLKEFAIFCYYTAFTLKTKKTIHEPNILRIYGTVSRCGENKHQNQHSTL